MKKLKLIAEVVWFMFMLLILLATGAMFVLGIKSNENISKLSMYLVIFSLQVRSVVLLYPSIRQIHLFHKK